MRMEPWEWDAFRAYYRAVPRFDPWWAMARVCQVVAEQLGGKEVPLETFLPKVEVVKPGRRRRRKPKRRSMTVEDFDRAMGL
ncbi:hypothetical protein [Paludisphaera sp.]|uniref:hypothetical protein n=1 Tax=Paludisphaera sp. TaxID=2017432 RepID=UPI00301C941B